MTPAARIRKASSGRCVKGALTGVRPEGLQFLQANQEPFGIGRGMDHMDLHVEALDLLGNRGGFGRRNPPSSWLPLALGKPPQPTPVLGDISIRGPEGCEGPGGAPSRSPWTRRQSAPHPIEN